MGWVSDALSDVGRIISSTSYWFGILTSFVLIFIGHRIKHPRVIVTGGGGRSHNIEDGEAFSSHHLSLTNSPSFLGYPINRETLFVESARIYDPEKKAYEGHVMRWQGAPEGKPFNTETKLVNARDCMFLAYIRSAYTTTLVKPSITLILAKLWSNSVSRERLKFT